MDVFSSEKSMHDSEGTRLEASKNKLSESSMNPITANRLYRSNRNTKWERKQNLPFSAGTVSGVLGKDYANHKRATVKSWVETKPVKLSGEPISESEPGKPITSKKERLRGDMEELVVKMLSDGFDLDKDGVELIIGQSGYELDKGVEPVSIEGHCMEDKDSSQSSANISAASSLAERSSQYGERPILNTNERKRNDIQSSVLTSLFGETIEKARLSRMQVKPKARSIALGKLVVSPKDFDSDEERSTSLAIEDDNDAEPTLNEDDPYVLNLKAAEEYRATMAEYYKAAIEAAKDGDSERSNRLIAQAEFYSKKAVDADAESTKMILNNSTNSQIDNDFLLELHNHGPKVAVRLLKSHLRMEAFNNLKVVLEEDGKEDTSKGARRRLVVKYLEGESISWREGETFGTILIPLDT